MGGGDLSIESRLFWRNICHFGANLTFKSDFESYFTFKKPHLRVQKWMGGEVLRSESRMFVDQLENSLESRKCQKGGGDQPFWTSPESFRGKLNEAFPK